MESPFRDIRLVGVSELRRLLVGRHVGHAVSARGALESMLDDDSKLVREAAEQALGTLDPEAAGLKGPPGHARLIVDRPSDSKAPEREREQVDADHLQPAQGVHQVHRDKESFSFLAAEYPTIFDGVWDSAVKLEKWPKFPTPAFRLACASVASGHSADEAVLRYFQ